MAETGNLYNGLDAETGDTSQFTSVVEGGTNTLTADVAAKAHGSYGFKVSYLGSSGTAYGSKTFATQTTQYHRFYIYIPSSLTITSYSTINFFQLRAGGTYVAQVGAQLFGNQRWAAQYRYDSLVYNVLNFSKDAWHYVEVKWVKDASVGGIEVKVDGDVALTDMNNDTSSYDVDEIRIGDVEGNDTPDNGDYFYFDDALGDTSPIGPFVDSAPEINLKVGSTDIINSGNYDFGEVTVDQNSDTTFTIENTGDANLILDGTPKVEITAGTYPCTESGCSGNAEYINIFYYDDSEDEYVYVHRCSDCGTLYYLDRIYSGDTSMFSVTSQPSSPVAADSSTTFIVRYTPSAIGNHSATMSIDNNDSDENPYLVTLLGEGVLPTNSRKRKIGLKTISRSNTNKRIIGG